MTRACHAMAGLANQRGWKRQEFTWQSGAMLFIRKYE
jgi:hypothetical protein